MTRWFVLILLCGLLLPAPATAQPPSRVDGDALAAQLAAALDDHAAEGVVLMLLDGEQVVYLAGIGQDADGNPIDPDAVYPLGAAAEPLVVTLYMATEERGLLPIGLPVVNQMPSLELPLARSAENIQVRRLLDHTAGLGMAQNGPLHPLDPGELTTITQASFPGARFSYCTRCTGLLLSLTAQVRQRAPADLLDATFFFPLRMDDTTFGDGQITAPAWDVARFMSIHLQAGRWGGAQIITPESVARMTVPRLETGRGLREHMGYGWWVTPNAGLVVEEPAQDRILRAYDMSAHTAQMALAPAYGRGILLLTDQPNPGLDPLMDIAMDAFFGWSGVAFEAPNPRGFEGTYRAAEGDDELLLTLGEGDALTVTYRGQSAPARFIGERTLVFDLPAAHARLFFETNWRSARAVLSIDGQTTIFNRRG